MERDCNKCVYSTRDGNCRKWSCEGTKTVEDIQAEAVKQITDKLIDFIDTEIKLVDDSNKETDCENNFIRALLYVRDTIQKESEKC